MNQEVRAILALLIATAVWGVSFALQKEAGAAVNQSMGQPNAVAGPMWVVGIRFLLASLLWAAIFSKARANWTKQSVRYGLVLGCLLFVPLAMQTMSLDFTNEATAAVFTAMAVLFTPLILRLFFKQSIQRVVWVAAALAVVGVWVKEGATNFNLGAGELLGLACAVLFAWHLIVLNVLVPSDDPYRMTLAQFVVTGVCALGLSTGLMMFGGTWPTWEVMRTWPVAGNIVLMVLFPTLVSFGLMNVFQPRVHAARAALIYLLEPIFAAAFAYWYRDQGVTQLALIGAGIMLAANALVELWPKGEREGGRAREQESGRA
jgi:drug/metabolite transporter (DMT)-like permease